MRKKYLEFDKIGYWSELKIQIIEKYAHAYSMVISAQDHPKLSHIYIDAFAGAGEHVRKLTGEVVPGSPLTALQVRPPFHHYYFIDLKPTKVTNLKQLIGERKDVDILEGDCNRLLLNEVFPRVRYEEYRRGLCLLDPYGLHLNWEVIAKAAEMKSLEIFLNFPVTDINRNVLWTKPERVGPEHIRRMNAFWGDESWRDAAYIPSRQQNLFGAPELERTENETIAEAFRSRLLKVAGFKYVPRPLPMRNSNNAIVYYLFFASWNKTAGHIVEQIFESYRDRKGS